MRTQEFREQIKAHGLEVRKQPGLEVLDVRLHGTELFSITYAELHLLTNVNELLAKKLRPDYIPPLG